VCKKIGMALKTPREKLLVLIYTVTHRIEGTYFKMPGSRLLDDLNGRKEFFPLTQVKVSSLAEGVLLFETEFMAIGKDQVVFVVEKGPAEAPSAPAAPAPTAAPAGPAAKSSPPASGEAPPETPQSPAP